MPTYKYSARDQEGKNVAGRIAAEGEAMIVAELRKRSLMILSVEEEKESVVKKTAKAKGGKKIKPEDLVVFYPSVRHHGGRRDTHFTVPGSAQ